MQILVLVLSLVISIRTLSYGIYELKQNNKSGGIVVIFVSVIVAVFPNVMVAIRGIY